MSDSKRKLSCHFVGSERRLAFHPSSAGVELEGCFVIFLVKCEELLFITSVIWLVFVFFWLNITINYFR